MDAAAAALADLSEISSQVEAAVVVDADGAVLAATGEGIGRETLARTGLALIETAEAEFGGSRSVCRMEVALREGSVFVVLESGLGIVARTSPSPASGLVFYDLGTCLDAVAASRSKPKRRRTTRKTEAADA